MSRDAVETMFANLRNSLSQRDFDGGEEDLEEFYDEAEPGDAGATGDEPAAEEPPPAAAAEIAHRGGATGWRVEDGDNTGSDDPAAPPAGEEDPFVE
jgi:hypothetical protein